MQPEFTARNAAKFLVTSIIAYKTTKLTAETIENHTPYDKDDWIVEAGAGVVGWAVSSKLSPVTNKAVDKAGDFIAEKREARRAKKDAKKKKD